MKANFYFKRACPFLFFFLFTYIGFGQLLINDYGSVNIGNGASENRMRLKITTTHRVGSVWHYGLFSSYADMTVGQNYCGVYGGAYRTSALSSGRSYGVLGLAGNYSSGFNYGVYGRIFGNNNGAGIFGTVNGDMEVNGKFAGFFNGNVNVFGVLTVNGASVITSDQRTKMNIKPLSETNSSLQSLLGLKPVSYNLETGFLQTMRMEGGDTTSIGEMFVDQRLTDRLQRGFIAQELQEIFPDLVFEDNEGMLAVNYIGLIPVIVDAIKEMQTIINKQEERIVLLEKTLYGPGIIVPRAQDENTTGEIEISELLVSVLYQNHPSAFGQVTTIRHFVPDYVKNATLHIYNMLGSELVSYTVTGRGDSTTNLTGYSFTPGMYLYALIVDGKEIDTKRMILTE